MQSNRPGAGHCGVTSAETRMSQGTIMSFLCSLKFLFGMGGVFGANWKSPLLVEKACRVANLQTVVNVQLVMRLGRFSKLYAQSKRSCAKFLHDLKDSWARTCPQKIEHCLSVTSESQVKSKNTGRCWLTGMFNYESCLRRSIECRSCLKMGGV